MESELLVSLKPHTWQNWTVLSSWEAVCLGVMFSAMIGNCHGGLSGPASWCSEACV